MKRTLLTLCALGLATLASQASASTILYYTSGSVGTDRMAPALAASGASVTTTNVLTTFSTDLTTGGPWDLVVFSDQNAAPGADLTTAFNNLAAYIAGGGKAIAGDWTESSTLGTAFDASYLALGNQSSVNITNGNLNTSIVSPVGLTNPGYGVFSTDLAPAAGGSSAATFPSPADSAIVMGNSNRTILNGFLNDVFSNGAQGQQLFTNEISFLLAQPSSVSTPEPSSLALLGLGVAGLLGYRSRRRLSVA